MFRHSLHGAGAIISLNNPVFSACLYWNGENDVLIIFIALTLSNVYFIRKVAFYIYTRVGDLRVMIFMVGGAVVQTGGPTTTPIPRPTHTAMNVIPILTKQDRVTPRT